MSNRTNTAKKAGVSVTGVLTLTFIALKLLGFISWSWWWVVSPLWLPFALVIFVIMPIGAAVVLYKDDQAKKEKLMEADQKWQNEVQGINEKH